MTEIHGPPCRQIEMNFFTPSASFSEAPDILKCSAKYSPSDQLLSADVYMGKGKYRVHHAYPLATA